MLFLLDRLKNTSSALSINSMKFYLTYYNPAVFCHSCWVFCCFEPGINIY